MLDASTLDDGPDASVAIVVQPAPYPAVLDRVLRSVGLTARERQVAALVVQGRSNKSIAAALSVSPWTVQDHLKAIFEKTGVRTRSEVGTFVAGALAR